MKRNLLTATEVAQRLGVRLETVYAYVSRGALRRTVAADGHQSRFDPVDVEELARRGRPRQGERRIGSIDVSIATSLTRVESDDLFYRGQRVTELARRASFEQVAELLWTDALPPEAVWPASREGVRLARTVREAMPVSATPLDTFAAVTAAMAPLSPLRVDLQPASVAQHARELLATLATALPLARGRPRPERSRWAREASHGAPPSLAAQLAHRLCPRAPEREHVRLVDAALVLLADHELATSTMAARVAASTRADPFAVVLSGLGALHGPLHGSAAIACHRILVDAEATLPEAAVAAALGAAGATATASSAPARLPGFGHPIYRADPRAAHLLGELAAVAPKKRRVLLERVATACTAVTSAAANVDFALAALVFVLEMPAAASEAIFALARSAGFIAHALEEYSEPPLRFRARALYVAEEAERG